MIHRDNLEDPRIVVHRNSRQARESTICAPNRFEPLWFESFNIYGLANFDCQLSAFLVRRLHDTFFIHSGRSPCKKQTFTNLGRNFTLMPMNMSKLKAERIRRGWSQQTLGYKAK